MSLLPDAPAGNALTTVKRSRTVRVIIATLLVLTLCTGAWFWKRNHDDVLWKQALARVPIVLARVPLPVAGEVPAVRFRAACALLGKDMDVPAATVEEKLAELARGAREPWITFRGMDECGAALTAGYLSPYPFDTNVLRLRMYSAAYLDDADTAAAGEAEWRALLVHQRSHGSPPGDVVRALNRLATNLWHQNRDTEAAAMQREALALMEATGNPEDAQSISSLRSFLARILHRQRKYAEEEPLLRANLAAGEANPPAGRVVEESERSKILSSASATYRAYREQQAARLGILAQQKQDRLLAILRSRLALCLNKQSKDEEATALANKALPIALSTHSRELITEIRGVLDATAKQKAPAPSVPPAEN